MSVNTCRYIRSERAPSTAYTSVRECRAYCLSASASNYFAGVAPISATDSTPGCYCFPRWYTFVSNGGGGCVPCSNEPSLNCGAYVGIISDNQSPAQRPPQTDSKSIYLYGTAPDPIIPSSPPAPSPPPQTSDSPIQQPVITETNAGGGSGDQSPTTDSPPPNGNTANPDVPAATTQRITVTSIVTGVDGIATARQETIISIIVNNAIITSLGRNPSATSTGGVGASGGLLPTSAIDGGSTGSSTPNITVIAGGVCAAVIAIVGAAALFFVRRSTKRKRDNEIKTAAAVERRDPPTFDDTNGNAATQQSNHNVNDYPNEPVDAGHMNSYENEHIENSSSPNSPVIMTPIPYNFATTSLPKQGLFTNPTHTHRNDTKFPYENDTKYPSDSKHSSDSKHHLELPQEYSTSIFPSSNHPKAVEAGFDSSVFSEDKNRTRSEKGLREVKAPPRMHSQRTGVVRGETVGRSMVEEAPPMYTMDMRQ